MCLSNRTHQNIYHNHTNTGLMWIKEKRKTFLNKYHKIMDFILQEAIAALHAQHKEEIAEIWAKSDARHQQQMAESKRQMEECLAGVKAML